MSSMSQMFYPGLFTPFDEENIKRGEAFPLARMFHVATKGALKIVSSSSGSNITMGNASGFNCINITSTRSRKNSNKTDYTLSRFNSAASATTWKIATSNNTRYLLNRAMNTPGEAKDSFDTALDYGSRDWMNDLYKTMLDRYMRQLARTSDVELNLEFGFDNHTQEWLLRVATGLSSIMDVPGSVRNSVDTARRAYDRKAAFVQNAHDKAANMFNREKWLVCVLDKRFIVCAFNTSPSVKIIGDALIRGGSLSYDLDMNKAFSMTYEPRAFSNLDDALDPAIRESLLSGLRMAKMSREATFPSATTGISGGGYFTEGGDTLMLNDGGWMQFRPAWGTANWLLVDKD